MILGDMGAEVLKVEQPGRGDDTRSWGPPFQGTEAAYFLGVNRNKRGITLNLKEPRGQAILRELIKKSDVVIENFKFGTMAEWGCGRDFMQQASAAGDSLHHFRLRLARSQGRAARLRLPAASRKRADEHHRRKGRRAHEDGSRHRRSVHRDFTPPSPSWGRSTPATMDSPDNTSRSRFIPPGFRCWPTWPRTR